MTTRTATQSNQWSLDYLQTNGKTRFQQLRFTINNECDVRMHFSLSGDLYEAGVFCLVIDRDRPYPETPSVCCRFLNT